LNELTINTPSLITSFNISVTFLAILINVSPLCVDEYKSNPNELSDKLPPEINIWPYDSWICISNGLLYGNLANLNIDYPLIPDAISNESALSSPDSLSLLKL